MSSELQYPFTREQIEEQARGNFNVAVLGAIAYAKAQGQDSRNFATFMGKLVTPGWGTITSPREAATAVALNCASYGMSVVSVGGDDARGEAVTSDWPAQELLEFTGLSQDDADQAWSIFEPIAQSLGYTFSWRREGGQLHFTVTK